MESRKLIKLGNSSFAVALPKDWVTKSGLKKGDTIFIVPNSNGELMVSPTYQNKNENQIKTFDFSDLEMKKIKNELKIAYVRGNNQFEIIGIEKRDKKEIENVIKNLINLEIIESSKDKIIAKNYFNIEDANIDNFVRRMDNAIRSMFEDLEIAIKQKKNISKKQFLDIYNTDEEINKFYLLNTRIMLRGIDNPAVLNLLKRDAIQLFNNWWIAFNLEHIGDALKRIAKMLNDQDLTNLKIQNLYVVFIDLRNNYVECLNAFYKSDKEVGKNVLEKNEHLSKMLNTLKLEKDSMFTAYIWRMSEIRESIYQLNKILLYSTGLA